MTNKDKPFRAALVRALGIAAADNNPEKLDKLAVALIARAAEGDTTALREVADRLDGKVPQALEHSGDTQRPVMIISGVRRAPHPDPAPQDDVTQDTEQLRH